MTPRAFRGLDWRLEDGPDLFDRTPSPRGSQKPLDSHVPGAPFCEEDDQQSRSRLVASPVARLCVSWGLAAFPRRQRQDASNPFLQPTFTSRAPAWNTTSGDLPVERRGKTRRRSTSRPPSCHGVSADGLPCGAGPPCGHPASSDSVLDGTATASGRRAPPQLSLGQRREQLGLFSRPSKGECSADSNPLTPSLAIGTVRKAPVLQSGWPRSVPVHVNATGPCARPEVPSTEKDRHLSPFEPGCGALPSLADEGIHRTFSSLFRKTSTRPLHARCSLAFWGPRALPRLLQVDIPAGTTMDHSSIPNSRGRPLGRLPGIEGRPSFPRRIADVSQGQGSRKTDSRRSPP